MKKFLLVLGLLAVVGLAAVSAAATTYKVASDTTWPPFEWQAGGGQLIGFDLDVMRLIAILEGYDVNIISYSWDIIFIDVGNGRVDIGASGATITAEREAVVDFSAPYWTSNQAVIVMADSDLNIASALSAGKKIGAQVGTTGAKWVQEQLIDKGVDVELVEYTLYPLAVLDLVNGNVDAVVQDEPASRASVAADARLSIVGVIETGRAVRVLRHEWRSERTPAEDQRRTPEAEGVDRMGGSHHRLHGRRRADEDRGGMGRCSSIPGGEGRHRLRARSGRRRNSPVEHFYPEV